MPRYTHLVVSAEQPERLKAAQDLGAIVAGVRTEAHCQDILEAGRYLLELESHNTVLCGIIKLRQPIEY
jgi:hypothetical protein